MEIGTRCEIIDARVTGNVGAIVVVTGDAGIRHINGYGKTQCYFLDREIKTVSGKWRNWGTEKQLNPLPPLCEKQALDQQNKLKAIGE